MKVTHLQNMTTRRRSTKNKTKMHDCKQFKVSEIGNLNFFLNIYLNGKKVKDRERNKKKKNGIL